MPPEDMIAHSAGTPLAGDGMSGLAALLAGDGLPTADPTQPGRLFRRVADGSGLLGYGGLEIHGRDGLLRSVAGRGRSA